MNAEHPWMNLEDFDLTPGSKMIVRAYGRERVATIGSISRETVPIVPAPRLSWRQRLLRRLTPARWRKPLPAPGYTQEVVTFKTDGLWREK